jgi:drug/metabolite transporter (DMT)-like permease
MLLWLWLLLRSTRLGALLIIGILILVIGILMLVFPDSMDRILGIGFIVICVIGVLGILRR